MSKRIDRKNRRRLRAASGQLVGARIDLECATPEFTFAKHDDSDGLPTFSMVANTGVPMRISSFGLPVVIDLTGINGLDRDRPVLLDHNPSEIVGHTTSIRASSRQVTVAGKISGVGEAAQEVVGNSKNGFPWRSSLGLDVTQTLEVEAGESTKVNGRNFDGPLLVASKSTLVEISFVPMAADDATSAKVAANAASKTAEAIPMKFKEWLTAKGFDLDELDEPQTNTLRASYDAEQAATNSNDGKGTTATLTAGTAGTAEPMTADSVQEMVRVQTEGERKRASAIGKIAAKYDVETISIDGKEVDFQGHCINENLSANDSELIALRASRAAGPAIHSRGVEADCTSQALEGSLMLRSGVALDSKVFQSPLAHQMDIPAWCRAGLNDDARQRAMELSHRYADMSLLDIASHAIRLDGKHAPSGRKNILKLAFSGGNLTNIFTTNVNTVVLATFGEAADTTRGWTSEADVADFKTNERPRLQKGGGLSQLPRGQTADHANRTDDVESYKIARYAQQWVIDDQDFQDDSFNALAGMPREMALAAARIRPDLVYSILFANANLNDSVALFNSTHNNNRTSAALATGTLQNAVNDIGIQTENSVVLNLSPTHLIVPWNLRFTAKGLLKSTESRDTTASTLFTTLNVVEGVVPNIVVEGRLDKGVTDPNGGTVHAGANTTWYVASTEGHTIEVAFLRGTGRGPSLRSFTLDRGAFGMGWDIKIDVGAKALDFHALHKSAA